MRYIWPVMWAALAITLAAAAYASVAERDRPSVLLIMTDDQRAETLQFMPKLQARIEKEKAWVFFQAYVTNPICCPSRSELMLGRPLGDQGVVNPVYRNEPPNGGPARLDFEGTLPHRMQKLGYETIIGGKWFNRWRQVGNVIPPFWDQAFINFSLTFDPFELLIGKGSPDGKFLPGQIKGIREHEATHVIDRLLDYLANRSAEKPFFTYFAPFSPHLPASVPNAAKIDVDLPVKFDSGRFAPRVRSQARSIAWLDGEIDRLISRVREIDPNTLIIFTADNGMMWGEKNLFGKAKPYEGSIKVPLIVFDPTGPGKTVQKAVNAPETINGIVSHRRSADTVASSPPPRRLFFYSFYKKNDFGVEAWRAMRKNFGGVPYKLIEFSSGRTELYNLRDDPGEARPIDDPAVGRSMIAQLRAFHVPIILDDNLPNAVSGKTYNHQLRTWDKSADCWLFDGQLPHGIFIRPNCRFGGETNDPGRYRFTVELRPKQGRDFSYFEEFVLDVR